MSEPKLARPGRMLLASAAFVLIVGAIALFAVPREYLAPRRPVTAAEEAAGEALPGGTAVYGTPSAEAPVSINTLSDPPAAAVIVDVHKPAELWRSAREDPWLQDVLNKPLGKGFLGTWAGFLGTRGEDLRAEFEGRVIDHLAERLLAAPFRAVWFAGSRTSGKPAFILENPSDAAGRAFAVLDRVASRGTYTAERCTDTDQESEGDRPGRLENITIKRWLLADHAVYASIQEDRLVIGRRATTVLQGMCADLPAAPAHEDGVFDIQLVSDSLGRGASLMTHVLGLDAAPRLRFDIREGSLVPLGIEAGITRGGHLVTGKLSANMLRAVPEAAPMVLAMQLALPEKLDREVLRQVFAGEAKADTPRQVAAVWYPSGEADGVMDIALLWSGGDDADLLDEMFAGNLMAGHGCDVTVRCTTERVCEKVRKACTGKSPSLLQAAPAVKAGWQAEASVALGVHLGRTLATMTIDAYRGENDAKGRLPAEMEEVKAQLEELPFFGLRGTVQNQALVPGGFRS